MQDRPLREHESRLTKLAPGPFVSRGGYIDYGRYDEKSRDAFIALDYLIESEYAEWPASRIKVSPRAIKDLSADRRVKIRDSDGKTRARHLPGLPKGIIAMALGCTVEHVQKMLDYSPPISRPKPAVQSEPVVDAPKKLYRIPWREEAARAMVSIGEETWSLLIWGEMLGIDDRNIRQALGIDARYTPEELVRRIMKKRRPRW